MNGRSRMNRRSGMGWKGTLFAILGVLVIGGTLGVLSEDEEVTDVQTEQVGAKEAKDDGTKIVNVGDAVKLNNLSITVNGSEERPYIEGVETQGKVILVDVTVLNNDKESRTIDDSMFQLTVGGTTYDPDNTLSRYANNGESLFYDKINPGLDVQSFIAFEVPEDLKDYDILVTGGVGTEAGEQTLIKLN